LFLNINLGFYKIPQRCCSLQVPRGLLIGVNQRKKSTWQPMLDVVKSQLSNWKNKQLSIGGRVVLRKSVLSSLPVYFLSFLKALAGLIT